MDPPTLPNVPRERQALGGAGLASEPRLSMGSTGQGQHHDTALTHLQGQESLEHAL